MSTEPGRRIFEIRTYTTEAGKLEALHQRFRLHTMRLFAKHGMVSVGYWVPQENGGRDTLVYILSHSSREAAERSWEAFRNDPEWQRVKAESEAEGRIVSRIESRFLEPTDYSPLQ